MSTDMEIILIGPVGTGKSTLGALLATKLAMPQVSLDDVRFEYYKEIGYDEALAQKMRETEGFFRLYRYWKPFEAYAVERVLADYSNCVIDFGAGHSVYEDDALFARVQAILRPYPHIILLLPSPDLDESVAILTERDPWGVTEEINFHEHFVKHHSNHDLAKFVVYTKDKTPDETFDEIVAIISQSLDG